MPNQNLVFVVDDDRAMLKGIARVLKQHGYNTVLFSSAAAFKSYNDFDSAICIILDINLNDGSGIELRHGLKAAGISVPVIYITGNDTPPFAWPRFNPDASPISKSRFRCSR